MHYDADFAGADPANAPLDAPLFIGADPMLWLVLLGAVAVAALLGWQLGRGASRTGGDAAERIWDDVHDAIRDAMKSSSHDLPGQVDRLKRLIDSRLGRTLKLAGGIAGPLKAMTAALDGAAPPKHGHKPAEPGYQAGRSENTAHGDGGHGAAAPAPVATATINILTGPAHDHGHAKPDHDHADEKKPLGIKERNAVLRAALDELHDHWAARKARIDEMRGAWDELSGVGLPPRRSGPHISRGH